MAKRWLILDFASVADSCSPLDAEVDGDDDHESANNYDSDRHSINDLFYVQDFALQFVGLIFGRFSYLWGNCL